MLKSVIEYVFGLHAELAGLRIDPCLPLSWTECSIVKVFRDCTYEIFYHGDGTGSDVLALSVNGKTVPADTPIAPVSGEPLKIDVTLGKKA